MNNQNQNKAKKILNSNFLGGPFRCKKREEIAKKIPKIEKTELPDVAGIVIAGVMELGCDSGAIRSYAAAAIGCDEDSIIIPFGESFNAREIFITRMIEGILSGTINNTVEDLFFTFYSFLQLPTEATRKLQCEHDIRTVQRYLACENRKPVVITQPIITIEGVDVVCQSSMLFVGDKKFSVKRRVGRKTVYETDVRPCVEIVRVRLGQPTVTQTGKKIDSSVSTSLELYAMLKVLQTYCKEHGVHDGMDVQANYYFLDKKGEKPDTFSDAFFGSGGNVVGIQTTLGEIGEFDEQYTPQMRGFLSGESFYPELCDHCKSKVFCSHKEDIFPIEEAEEKEKKECVLPVLSPAQTRAATQLAGPVRVIATAGSGKTTAMAYRILNLLQSGVKPEKIGCFTFTNAGAGEMRARIEKFCMAAGLDVNIDRMTISTIHSFGDGLIKANYALLEYKKPPVLINEIQRTKIIEGILATNPPIEGLREMYQNFYMANYSAIGILEFMKEVFSEIKEKNLSEEDLTQQFQFANQQTAAEIMRLYQQYEADKMTACLIEHADQELLVLELLKKKPDLFDAVGLQHISVDEYQDTSDVQFQIIHAMQQASCTKSLFVVGDDDQSIYGFRSANVRLIKDFFNMIGEPGVDVQLMENRRSTGNIVNFANAIIDNNEDRVAKSPVSVNEAGKPVSVQSFGDKSSEMENIVQKVAAILKSGKWQPSDIAILTPTNAELLEMADLLSQQGIRSVNINPEPILENPRVLAAIALVRFMLTNHEFSGVVYLNVRDGILALAKEEAEIKDALEGLQSDMKGVDSVTKLFTYFTALDPSETDEIYQAFLTDIRTAKEQAVACENLDEVTRYIMDFERFGKKETARKEKAYDGVVLSTMHSAKGKEWPVVFCSVTKLHGKGLQTDEIPEKNRLLFVACTRAKKELYVSGLETAYGSKSGGYVQNMFLAECVEALVSQQNAA